MSCCLGLRQPACESSQFLPKEYRIFEENQPFGESRRAGFLIINGLFYMFGIRLYHVENK